VEVSSEAGLTQPIDDVTGMFERPDMRVNDAWHRRADKPPLSCLARCRPRRAEMMLVCAASPWYADLCTVIMLRGCGHHHMAASIL
jgi:hypothetical protein